MHSVQQRTHRRQRQATEHWLASRRQPRHPRRAHRRRNKRKRCWAIRVEHRPPMIRRAASASAVSTGWFREPSIFGWDVSSLNIRWFLCVCICFDNEFEVCIICHTNPHPSKSYKYSNRIRVRVVLIMHSTVTCFHYIFV